MPRSDPHSEPRADSRRRRRDRIRQAIAIDGRYNESITRVWTGQPDGRVVVGETVYADLEAAIAAET